MPASSDSKELSPNAWTRPTAAVGRDIFIKTKCSNAQELVVGGYAPSTVRPRAIGRVGCRVYDHGQLIYAGRVGTGYTQSLAQDLWKRLHPLEIDAPPFDQIPPAEAAAATSAGSNPRR